MNNVTYTKTSKIEEKIERLLSLPYGDIRSLLQQTVRDLNACIDEANHCLSAPNCELEERQIINLIYTVRKAVAFRTALNPIIWPDLLMGKEKENE